ncbi:MAG: 16S rRNA (cytosine(967)-C(5))-methyltransferase RsmB [Firmicutes bacterium]|nr:16S rRNA (cytosine(967)-C(5))-methyltransferase RsmB [Bacillota bacterium]HPU01051.1 16S rRNA (cytosine(967)-C(5))-methyltransferase RsmB [Bacillota bacterium]
MAGRAVTAREAALQALYRLEQEGAFLNLALPPLLEKLPPPERALARELAFGTVRRRNTLDWALGLFLKHPLEKMTPWMRNLLRMGAYQLLYLERVPPHAAVDETVKLAHRYGHRGVAGLANAVLRRLAAAAGDLPWPDPSRRPTDHLALRESHPPWLVERWRQRFGLEEARLLCQANNLPPPVALRPNRLRIDPAALKEILAAEGVSASFSPRLPGVLLAKAERPVSSLDSFRQGLFTVQGESSILVAPLLQPQAGEHIVDLCSAPGGKSTHLAELMGDCGRVTAVDIHPHRLKLVEQAAQRLGLASIKTLLADGRQIASAGLPAPQRLLVDAPCSGLGVIRRLPELKWRRRPAEPAEMARLQLELLEAAAALLRPGGMLLYSVCTFEPEETAAVVQAFRAAHPCFRPLPLEQLLPPELGKAESAPAGGIYLYPHRHGLDGFFMALWRRE